MLPSLVNLIAVLAGGGGIVGAIIGFAVPTATTRELFANIATGAQIGGVAGAAIAFTIWGGGSLAGA